MPAARQSSSSSTPRPPGSTRPRPRDRHRRGAPRRRLRVTAPGARWSIPAAPCPCRCNASPASLTADARPARRRSPRPTSGCVSSAARRSSSARTSPSTSPCWARRRRAAARRRRAARASTRCTRRCCCTPSSTATGSALLAAHARPGRAPAPRPARRAGHRRLLRALRRRAAEPSETRAAPARRPPGGRSRCSMTSDAAPPGAPRAGSAAARRGRDPSRPAAADGRRPALACARRRLAAAFGAAAPWRPPSRLRRAARPDRAGGRGGRPARSRGGIGLFEAGTGMGKSLAYLLPAAFRAAARGERVMVSTKTKALQRQLAAHELPLVAAALPPGWRWALLMGRENYLCRRRLDEAVADAARRPARRERAARPRVARRPRPARRGRPLGASLPRHAGAAGARRPRPRAALLGGHLPGPPLPRAHALPLAAGACARRGRAPRLRQPRPAADRRRHAAAVRGPRHRRSPLLPDEAVVAFSERVDRAHRRRVGRRRCAAGAASGRWPPRVRAAGRRGRRQPQALRRGGRRPRARRRRAARPCAGDGAPL